MDMQAAVTVMLIDRFTAAARNITGAAKGIVDAVKGGRGAASDVGALNLQYARLGAQMQKIKGLSGGLFSRGLIGTASVVAAKYTVVAGMMQQIMGPAVEMERFRMQLEQLEGSADKGKNAMSWIMDFAVKTPLELPQVVEAYARLKTMGIDPTNGSLLALTDSMAASGHGAEYLERMALAIGQAWTKTKLQGDDARQLLEAGVPVWDLLSQKMGITQEQVIALSSAGKLGRKEITMLLAAMEELNAGASANASTRWDGIIGNIHDAWYRFRVQIADAGPFQELKNNLQGVLDTINRMNADGSLAALAEKIGKNLTSAIRKAAAAGRGLWNALLVVARLLDMAAGAVGGYENLAYLATGLFMVGKALRLIMAVGEAAATLSKIVALGGAGSATSLLGVAGGIAAIAAAVALINSQEQGWVDKINSLRPNPNAPSSTARFASAYDPNQNFMMPAGNAAQAAGQMVREQLVRAFDQAKAAIQGKIGEILALVRAVGPQMVAALRSGLGSLYEVGAQFMQSLLDGIQAKAGAIMAYAAGIGAKIKGAFTLGGAAGAYGNGNAAGGQGFGLPAAAAPATDGARAFGGSVSAGKTYRVNERGPEVLTPSRHMAITPLAKMMNANRPPAVVTNNFSISGDVNSSTLQKLADTLTRRFEASLHDGIYAT